MKNSIFFVIFNRGSHSWAQSPTGDCPDTLLCPEGAAVANSFAKSPTPHLDTLPPPEMKCQ